MRELIAVAIMMRGWLGCGTNDTTGHAFIAAFIYGAWSISLYIHILYMIQSTLAHFLFYSTVRAFRFLKPNSFVVLLTFLGIGTCPLKEIVYSVICKKINIGYCFHCKPKVAK